MQPLTPFDRIEAERARAGITQTELCRKAGLAENTLRMAKSRGTELKVETLSALSQVLRIPLSALLGEAPPAATMLPAAGGPLLQLRSYLQLRPSKLNPRVIDLSAADQMEALQGLADTIEMHGLVEPLVIRPDGEIVAGERRWRAIGLLVNAGKWGEDDPRIPCIERTVNDQLHLELALIENGQRLDVPPLQEAEGFAKLQKLDPKKWTAPTIAAAIGKTARHVQLRLALLTKLHPQAQGLLAGGKISLAQARALTIAPTKVQQRIANDIACNETFPHEYTADDIRGEALDGMVPVKRAIFKTEDCGLETFTDEETNAVYFTDEKAFKAKQKAAARKLVKDLEPNFKSVELVEGYFQKHDYVKADKDAIAKGKALCFVVMSYDGTVTIKRNLVKKGSTKASTATEDKQRKADEAALKDMETAIAERLREKPENALRYYLLNMVIRYDDDLPSVDHYDLELSDDLLRGDLKALGKLVNKGGPIADAAGAWRAVASLDKATALAAFADAVARAIMVREFTVATWELAEALDVELAPAHAATWRKELAGDQVELEGAIARAPKGAPQQSKKAAA